MSARQPHHDSRDSSTRSATRSATRRTRPAISSRLSTKVLNWIDEAEAERCSQCGETECREDTHGRDAQPSPSSGNEQATWSQAALCPGLDTSEVTEMQTRPTRRRAPREQRTTHYDELEARSTISRLQLAVEAGDQADAAAAAEGWRQAARLAGRLQRQARTIADELEHGR